MLTLNGIPTQFFQDVEVRGDLDIDGELTFVNSNAVVYEGDVVTYENEIVTYKE